MVCALFVDMPRFPTGKYFAYSTTFFISTVADYLHISVSYLSHEFKKNLHISPYQYILKKKLTAANQKIKNSTPPMQAAMQCGFNDYSGFYKAYKKLFNTAPSEKDLNTKY